MAIDPLLEEYLRHGATRNILAQSLQSSRPPSLDQPGEKGPGGLLGGILRLASNLDRPGGAVRAAVGGHNPISGFQRPQDYSLVDPNDSPFMRFLGGAAESILDPLNLVGAKWMSPLAKESSFATKFAAEAGINIAARQASDLAANATQDNSNPWVRGLAPLAAGLAGGAAAGGAIHSLGRAGASAAKTEPTAVEGMIRRNFEANNPTMDETLKNISQQFPVADFANRSSITPQSLEDAISQQEANARIAAFGQLGKPIRESAAANLGSSNPPAVMDWTQQLQNSADEFETRLESAGKQQKINDTVTDPNSGKNYDALQLKLAEDTFRKTKNALDNLPDPIKARFLPSWAAQTVNGKINRSPLAHAAASEAHSYEMAQMAIVAEKRLNVDALHTELFGKTVDKVTFKPDAPQTVRHGFIKAQAIAMQGKGEGNWLATDIVMRNRENFNLSPAQNEFLDSIQEYLKADNNLSKDKFGVPITELSSDYDPRAHTMRHEDGSDLTPDESIRLLGGNQSFQHHRMFDKPEEIALAAADPEYMRQSIGNKLQEAIKKKADPAEINRLTDLYNSKLKVDINPVSFADAFANRLAQSSAARTERFVLQQMRERGASIKDIHEMESLIGSHRISEAVTVPAEAAAFLRQMTLSADFSVLGSHAIGHVVMGNGMKGLLDHTGGFMSTVASKEAFGRFLAANADEIATWANHGLELNTNDFIVPDSSILHRAVKFGAKNVIDPVTGKPMPIKAGGTDVNLLGRTVRNLDEIQYGRMVKMWKLDTARHVYGLMKGGFFENLIKGHPGIALGKLTGAFRNMNDDQLMEAASKFSNNLYGGLNRVEEGRTAVHNLLESLFVLTPGFTRGTLNIGAAALNPLKWDANAALSRDFAVRGLALASTVMVGLGAAFGTSVNVTDPSRSDWMELKLPDGKSIKPLSRWRSTGQITGKTFQTLLEAGPIEAAQYFGGASVRWGAQRQSGLISGILGDPVGDVASSQFGIQNAGNSFASGTGIIDILTNPSVDRGRQIGEGITRAIAPATLQNVIQTTREDGSLTSQGLKNVGFTIATEFLGVNSQGLTQKQQALLSKGADWAANHGMDAQVIQNELSLNHNPLFARDAEGRYIFDSKTRQAGVDALSAELGVSNDQVYSGGRMSANQQRAELDAIKNAQIDSFFQGMDIADTKYSDTMANIQKALDSGVLDYPAASKLIGDARKTRADSKGMVESLNPAALAFLQSPDQLAKKNSKDLLYSAIAAEYFSKDFFNPDTMSFDYDAQAAWQKELRAKYGKNFDDWQQQYEDKKTPLERQRDAAFDYMDSYFRVGDTIWQKVTGGMLGQNEGDFDKILRQMLQDGGVTEPGALTYITNQIKSNLLPVKYAKNATEVARDTMRASDPQMEQYVTQWLGNVPIQLKSLSKSKRAYINNLLMKQTSE